MVTRFPCFSQGVWRVPHDAIHFLVFEPDSETESCARYISGFSTGAAVSTFATLMRLVNAPAGTARGYRSPYLYYRRIRGES